MSDDLNYFGLGQRLATVALTTGVSRGAVLSYGWPECHKKNCGCHHADEDEVVGLVLKRVGDHIIEQLLANDALRADVAALYPKATEGKS